MNIKEMSDRELAESIYLELQTLSTIMSQMWERFCPDLAKQAIDEAESHWSRICQNAKEDAKGGQA